MYRTSDASPEYIKKITEKTINKNKVKLVFFICKIKKDVFSYFRLN